MATKIGELFKHLKLNWGDKVLVNTLNCEGFLTKL